MVFERTQKTKLIPQGRISLWRYTENARNYPGWHLNVDVEGGQFLCNLLDGFLAGGVGPRAIRITPPTSKQLSVPNNRGGRAAWFAPTEWVLVPDANLGTWLFPSAPSEAMLTLGAEYIPPLRKGIAGLLAGQGDYAIGDTHSRDVLWFWW